MVWVGVSLLALVIADPCEKLTMIEPAELHRAHPRERVLVTGGAGFIGSHIVEILLDLGYWVRVLDDLTQGTLEWLPLQHPHLEFVYGDASKLDLVKHAMKDADGVLHLSGVDAVAPSLRHPDKATEAIERNVLGTANILQAAHDAKVHKVVYSSSATFYGNQKAPMSEDMGHITSSPLATSKFMGEQLMHMYSELFDVRTLGLRLFNIYGPRMPVGNQGSVVSKFIAQKAANKPLIIEGEGDQLLDFVHVKDAARAFVLAYQGRVRVPTLNVGSGRPVSVKQLADMIQKAQVHSPRRPHDIDALVADTCLVKKTLHWDASIKFAEGMKNFLADTADHRAPYWRKTETTDYFSRQIPEWSKLSTEERMAALVKKIQKTPDYIAIAISTIREMTHEEL